MIGRVIITPFSFSQTCAATLLRIKIQIPKITPKYYSTFIWLGTCLKMDCYSKGDILMNEQEFKSALNDKGIKLNNFQMEQFKNYYELLVEWNQKVNLTAITDKIEVYLKHFYDSITAAFYYDFTKKFHMCDIGAGAGFPSIPLKICFPQIQISIVDSLKKRIEFLELLGKELALKNVSFYHGRAEDFGKDHNFREKFDVVIARAVARMSVLNELCLPLAKLDGVFIAMKGSQGKDELENSEKSVNILGGNLSSLNEFLLPIENSERSIVIIKKVKNTPKKYPRKAGTPNKNPIV